jgi:hypothetical protein
MSGKQQDTMRDYIREVNLNNGRVKMGIGILHNLTYTGCTSKKETTCITNAITEMEKLRNILIIRGALCQMRKMLQ